MCQTGNYDYLCKIVCIGNAGSGKSTLVTSYKQGKFTSHDEYYRGEPVGIDFVVKTIDVDNSIVKMQIWDTAGQERFRTITRSYYRGANIILLMYSVLDYESYDDIRKLWYDSVKRSCRDNGNKDAIIILVANKCDRNDHRRQVSTELGYQLADELDIKLFEVSASTYDNVDALFKYCAKCHIQQTTQQIRNQLCSNLQFTKQPQQPQQHNKQNNRFNLSSCCIS